MKFVISTAMFLLCLCSAHATEKEELAKKLIVAMKSEKLIDQVFQSLGPALSQMIGLQDPNLTEEGTKELTDLLDEMFVIAKDTFPTADFMKVMQEVYLDLFSEEELRGLLAFYESPLGQVWAEKQSSVMTASGVKIQPIIAAWYPEFQQKIDARYKLHKESKGK